MACYWDSFTFFYLTDIYIYIYIRITVFMQMSLMSIALFLEGIAIPFWSLPSRDKSKRKGKRKSVYELTNLLVN
jgi:hypothetical protein